MSLQNGNQLNMLGYPCRMKKMQDTLSRRMTPLAVSNRKLKYSDEDQGLEILGLQSP